MVLQSIVLYTSLILIMVVLAKFYSITKPNYQVINYTKFNHSASSIYLILAIISFTIMMGLRYDVGTDYISYQEGYISNYDVGKGEILFNWVRQVFNSLELHYSLYFTFFAFLNISFYLIAFKKNTFILPLLVFFFFTNGDWLVLMNLIRQGIAMCIWIYALNYIYKKQFLRYLFWCLIAIGFHTSAIILIPLYWILKNEKDYFKNIKLQFLLLGGAFIFKFFFSFFIQQINPLIQYYQSQLTGGTYNYSIERFSEEASSNVEGSGIAYLFRIALSIVIILYSEKVKKYYNNRWFNIIYFMFFIGLLAENMFPVGSIVLTRPFRYFFIFKGIMFAYFTYYLLKNNLSSNKLLGYAIILIFIGIFYLNIMTASPNSHLWYHFYFQK